MQIFYLFWREKRGVLGKIQGSIEGRPTIGTIYKNTNYGVYGDLTSLNMINVKSNKKLPVALRNEIKEGKATLIATLENDKPQEYEIEITKIYTNNNLDNKSMVIKITDKELLEKTGGIVQGMSGSPIIQNGKLVRCTYSCNGKWFGNGICSFCRAYGQRNEYLEQMKSSILRRYSAKENPQRTLVRLRYFFLECLAIY